MYQYTHKYISILNICIGEIDAWLADMDEAAMEQGIGEAAKALRVIDEYLFVAIYT
jgi:hypothetical protein